jgi:hypothetical protein
LILSARDGEKLEAVAAACAALSTDTTAGVGADGRTAVVLQLDLVRYAGFHHFSSNCTTLYYIAALSPKEPAIP